MSSNKHDQMLAIQRSPENKNGVEFKTSENSQCKIESKYGPPPAKEVESGKSTKDNKGKPSIKQQVSKRNIYFNGFGFNYNKLGHKAFECRNTMNQNVKPFFGR